VRGKAIATPANLTKHHACALRGLTGLALPPVAVLASVGALLLTAFASSSCTNRIEVGSYATALAPDGGSLGIRNERKAQKLAAGGSSTCAIAPSGGVVCWGGNEYGELGTGSKEPAKSVVPVPVADSEKGIVALSGSAFAYCALSDDGRSRCWGDSAFGQSSVNGGAPKPIHAVWYLPLDVPKLGEGITQLRSGLYYGAALTVDGRVRTWGLEGHGQLGLGTIDTGVIPNDVPVPDLRFVDLAASPAGAFTCAVTSTGDVYCWGANERGQLGDGTLADRSTPGKVLGLSNRAVQVTCGRAHACALLETTRVACWGAADLGQLGKGKAEARPVAEVITSLPDLVEVRAGHDHTCSRAKNGEITCWGSDDKGQLSGKTLGTREFGPQVSLHAAFGAEYVAAGGKHSCAMAKGQVRCWGSNTAGQRGENGAFDL
jgi:alpha-tubulin suppressor-like RCC1 family protein